MRIYIADLLAYNDGLLKGEWIKLPAEETEIQKVLNRHTQNGKGDFAIHNWELDFEISEYADPFKINEACKLIQEYKLNESLLSHIELAFDKTILELDERALQYVLEETNTIEVDCDEGFAREYFEDCERQLDFLPWELTSCINYDIVFSKLEHSLVITEHLNRPLYYYSNR
ncbi:antirestriction protein ArdA [Cetobacterium sp.]|uniref:antirestriction protein ArdA n=1 Tax=Cetobacterium sp. TaxID=2071632 RepID=UPI003F3DC19F